MQTILILIITIIIGLDFYIRNEKLIKKVFKKTKKRLKGGKEDCFGVMKKGVGEKAMEELNNNL